MKITKSMKLEFAQEIAEIHKQLTHSVNEIIKTKMKEKEHFENFGNLVDRVYGVAMTYKFQEIAEYTKKMKEVSYCASQSDNMVHREKVVRLMIECLKHFDILPQAVFNKDELQKVSMTMNIVKGKAENMLRTAFAGLKTKSCA